MQLADGQRLISQAYIILSSNEEYALIKHYMIEHEILHDSFWSLHKKLSISQGNLRNALNNFSEASEKTVEILYQIKNLIARDEQNKKNLYLKKLGEEKIKLREKLKSLELELEEKKVDAMTHLP